MSGSNPLAADLDHIIGHTEDVFEDLREALLFITGGTGFFGRWLLESFAEANRRLNLNASAVVLTRSKDAFAARCPHLASDPAIAFHIGDVRTFESPVGAFTHVIHAATPASAALNDAEPLVMLDTIVEGTRRVLEFAVGCGARKLLLASSGAVYGRQPAGLPQIPETYAGTSDTMNPGAAYAEGKRVAELLCAIYARSHGIETKIARCFAFVGPHLPLDAHFAAGNFIRDGLRGGPIRIEGDGTPLRSYLYAADLMIWLWTILVRGESCRPYNVGSDEEVTILELAEAVATLGPDIAVQISKQPVMGALPHRYVPDVDRAHKELDLEQFVCLAEALRRTAVWGREEKVTR
jgi:nucleoside-diphosphate-sugar epimerase